MLQYETIASRHNVSYGPPFFTPGAAEKERSAAVRGWEAFVGPQPNGFTASASLDSYNGTYEASLAAAPHPPNAPLTIGWYWWGWRRRNMHFPYYGFVILRVQPTQILVSHNGGNWAPKCSVSLHQGSRLIAERIVNMYPGQICTVILHVPRVWFDLSVGGSVRAVYSGAANPYGSVKAEVLTAQYVHGGALAAEPEPFEDATAPDGATSLFDEADEATLEEVREQLSRLHDQAQIQPLGSVDEVKAAGLSHLG